LFLIESEQKDNHTELVIYSRDENGKKHVKRVKDFRPYLYVPEEEVIPDHHCITGVETGHKAILGEPVKKVFVKKSNDVPIMREIFSKTYESDVSFTQRYIVDEIGEIDPYKLKILYLDLELDTDDVFPDLESPNQAVTCISIIDNFSNTPITYFYESPDAEVSPTPSEHVKVFKTEEELLLAVLAHVIKEDPDILTGWNSNKFDFPYLIRRMKMFNIPFKKLSPHYFVTIDDRYGDAMIKGRIMSDMMVNYQHFRRISNQGNPESYSLEFTSNEVLGSGKIKMPMSFRTMWLKDPDNLIKYNVRDIMLVKDINEKLTLVDFFNQIRCKSCSQLDRIYYNTVLIDGLLLRRLRGKYVLPNKNNGEGEKYSGAYVLLPKPGVYSNVFAFDVKGMYPNIIKSFNMGFETFNPNGKILIEEGVGFDRGIGIISETIRDLESQRTYWKSERNKAGEIGNDALYTTCHHKQYAMKVFANSIYGYLGFPKSRLYKKAVANAITTIGRKIIKWTVTLLENNGYEIIYGDTDSVYFASKTDTIDKMMDEGQILLKKINESYKRFVAIFGVNPEDCSLEMEFEKIFKSILFVCKRGEPTVGAKKKYAFISLWEDGKMMKDKVKYKGFATVRSDTPRISRDAQKDVISKILHGSERQEIMDYLTAIDKKIRNGDIPVEDIAFPGAITNDIDKYGVTKDTETGGTRRTGTPPVVQGARYANKYLGTRFTGGMKPKWIYVKSVPVGYPDTKYITFVESVPSKFIPNYDEMINRIFKMKLDAIFTSVGWGDFPVLNTNNMRLSNWGKKL